MFISPMSWIVAAFALLFAALLGAAGMAYAQGARGICAAEFSPSCVWLGPLQNNGKGLIVVNGPEGR